MPRITLDLDGNDAERLRALRKRLRVASAMNDETMSQIGIRAIERELDRLEGRAETVAPAGSSALVHQIARRRDYAGPCTQVGTQMPVELWTAVRHYCIEHSLTLRLFIIDAVRRHLRLCLRGGPEAGQPRPERRIVTS